MNIKQLREQINLATMKNPDEKFTLSARTLANLMSYNESIVGSNLCDKAGKIFREQSDRARACRYRNMAADVVFGKIHSLQIPYTFYDYYKELETVEAEIFPVYHDYSEELNNG